MGLPPTPHQGLKYQKKLLSRNNTLTTFPSFNFPHILKGAVSSTNPYLWKPVLQESNLTPVCGRDTKQACEWPPASALSSAEKEPPLPQLSAFFIWSASVSAWSLAVLFLLIRFFVSFFSLLVHFFLGFLFLVIRCFVVLSLVVQFFPGFLYTLVQFLVWFLLLLARFLRSLLFPTGWSHERDFFTRFFRTLIVLICPLSKRT